MYEKINYDMIEKYKEINESDVVLDKEITELNPRIFRLKLSGIKEECLIAIIDNKPDDTCSLCGLRKINQYGLIVDINNALFHYCADFCIKLEEEFENLTGIEAHTFYRSLIFLEQKDEFVNILASIDPTENIEVNFGK